MEGELEIRQLANSSGHRAGPPIDCNESMKALWIFLLALSCLQPSYGESLSTRQALIEAPEFDSVVPIGRRMTLVLSGEHSLFGARGVSEASFEQAVANLCQTKWLFSRIDVDPMSGRGEKVDASLAPQDAAAEIFRVGGTDCAEQFRVSTRAKSSFMGLASPVAILFRQDEGLVWKGRVKVLYESGTLPPNGMVDGRCSASVATRSVVWRAWLGPMQSARKAGAMSSCSNQRMDSSKTRRGSFKFWRPPMQILMKCGGGT